MAHRREPLERQLTSDGRKPFLEATEGRCSIGPQGEGGKWHPLEKGGASVEQPGHMLSDLF